MLGDGFLVGFVGVLKVIDGDGGMSTQFIAHEMNNYETVGVLAAVLDRVRASNAMYDSWEEEEED